MIEQHFSVFEQKHTRDYGVAAKMKGEEIERLLVLRKI
jgi:hypothetical protein